MTERGENSFQCVATLAERDVKRFTPAGIPIVAARLLHSSEQVEAGVVRRVEFEVAAVAAGTLADRLERADLGQAYRFSGFIARKNRNSRTLVFHLTDIDTIS